MKTVLITGANRGIGFALAKVYSENDFKVYATCRSTTPELSSLKNTVVIDGVDVTRKETFNKMKEALKDVKVDIFINNAGVLHEDKLGETSENSLRIQFEVNSIAPLMVTTSLLPFFKKGTKIGIMTSRMGSVSDNTSGGYYGYRASKAAANAIGRSLAMDLKPYEITVVNLHPGFVQTEMTGGNGEITSDISAHGLYKVLENITHRDSGSFWHTNGERLPY